jgi:hypothetical protein
VSVLDVLEAPEAAAAPGTYPVPPGRGRWRLTLHRRQFAAVNWQTTLIGEFQLARARKLVQTWLKPAVLTFDLDGQAPAASLFTELQHDVIAWRWDDTAGTDRPVFRGVINASQDQLDESSHVVSVTCTDYLMLLTRRILWTAATYTNMDQDTLAATILGWATGAQSSGGTVFGAGAYLPLSIYQSNPDGTSRPALSGNLVTRSYYGQQVAFDAFDALAKCLGGFEYDVLPLGGVGMGTAAMTDQLRIFYAGPTGPQQGVLRTSPALVYGSSVSKVTRQITSADYGNYWRELGNSQSNDPSVQEIGEAANVDASGTVVGLWASPDNQASTVLAPTLVAAAAGNLNRYGVLIPVYVLTLRPGFYYAGAFNMGDTLPLVIMHGRLEVNTTVRILGITYNIGDDGQEDVEVVVGRPDTTLYDVIGGVAADVDALARR